ncbi:MAG: transglutaminase family protein [archaeon]
MKRKFLLLPLILLSCSLPVETSFQIETSFQTPGDVCVWVHDNIRYKPDETDYWQSPEETFTLRTGECGDFALLMIKLCKEKLDLECSLVLAYKQLPDKISFHALVLYDTFYDPTAGTSDDLHGYSVAYVQSYSDLWFYGYL